MPKDIPSDDPAVFTPAEVARLFRVNTKTVSRWAKSGKLDCFMTAGGHRRYRKEDIIAMLNGNDGDKP